MAPIFVAHSQYEGEPSMCFAISLIPATLWLIVGYFVLFAAFKIVPGGIRAFGIILAIWLFIIAAGIAAGGAYASASGLCHIGEMMRAMHSRP